MKLKTASIIRESYKTYPYKSHNSDYFITSANYTKIMDLFLDKLGYYMIVTGRAVRMPANLGFLQLVRYNPPKRKKFVDFKTSKILKEINPNARTVGYTNMKTNGQWVRLHWYKSQKRGYANTASFLSNYGFDISRFLKRSSSWVGIKDQRRRPKLTVAEFFKEKGWTFYAYTPLMYSKNKMNLIKLLNTK